MPSSQNRRRIEIPADLYQRLTVRAEHDRTTVAALAARLLHDGLTTPTAQDALGTIQQQLSAIYERLDSLHTDPHVAPLQRIAGPMTIRPELLERARQELSTICDGTDLLRGMKESADD